MKKSIIILAVTALSLSSQAQTVTPDSVIYDIYNRQNTHMQYNKAPLEFYGSGDVNLDGKITYADAQAIANGTTNWMSDVNADSLTNEEDKQIILNYINGTGKLPGLEYDSLSSQEKRDWIMKTAKNLDNTKYVQGQNCSYQTRNLLHNFNGFYNKEGYYEKFDGETIDTSMHAEMNLRGLYVSLNHINGVAHITPGFLTTDTLTNLKNYLIFDAVTKQNSSEFMRTNENDKVRISWYGYSNDFLGNPTFDENDMIEFKFNANHEPIVSYVNPNVPQVNPKIISLEASSPEDKVLEYSQNLNLNSDEYGSPNYTTNLTLGDVLEVEDFYSSTTTNLLETKKELLEKTKLFEGEKGDYNYTVKKKFTGELKQKTKAHNSNSGYDEVTIPLKKIQTMQMFTVLDRTNPKITLRDLQDKNYVSNLQIDKEMIIKSVTDNAKVDTSGIKDVNSTQVMDGTINQVNYTVSGKAFARDVSDNDTTLNWSFNVKDTEAPSQLAIPSDTTIALSDLENGVLTPEVSGIASATDNSELPVNINYEYTKTGEDEHNIYYDNSITFTDIAGNDTSAVQKIKVDKGVGVEDRVLETEAAYPNPTTGKVSFNYQSTGAVKFNVFNSSGQRLENMVDSDGKAEFDLSRYPQGVYFIGAEDESGKTATKKVFKY